MVLARQKVLSFELRLVLPVKMRISGAQACENSHEIWIWLKSAQAQENERPVHPYQLTSKIGLRFAAFQQISAMSNCVL